MFLCGRDHVLQQDISEPTAGIDYELLVRISTVSSSTTVPYIYGTAVYQLTWSIASYQTPRVVYQTTYL